MLVTRIRPLDARRGILTAALTALLLLALAPASATAVSAGGTAVLKLQPGKATTDLLKQGVQLSYTAKTGKTGSAKRVSAGSATTLRLPVEEIVFAKADRVGLKGNLVFSRGKSKVVVRDLSLRVAAKQTTLVGKVGKRTVILFRATGKSENVANTVGLQEAPFALTGKAAGALAPRLGLDSIKPGHLGLLSVTAVQDDLPKPEEPKKKEEESKKEESKPEEPQPDPCALAVTSTGGWTAPTLVAAPDLDSPADVLGGSADWTFKTSLRGYVMGGGAVVPVPPVTVPAPPMGAFRFPVTSGVVKLDASGGLADRAVVNGSGEVKLCHAVHGFSVMLSNPTLTLNGANSRLTVDVETNMSGVHTPRQRVDLATLDMDEVVPFYSENTKTSAWKDVPVILTEAGSEALQLCDPQNPGPCEYEEGDALDPVSFELRTGAQMPWPYNAGCNLSGIANMPKPAVTNSWPEIPAGPAGLPELNAPEAVDGDFIEWGLRSALRGSVGGTGVFNLLGGADKSDVSMSGANKFFKWPVTSAVYKPASGGNPERLIVKGTGMVGFCQHHSAQAYGTVLSNPTLVIDGANSRLTMTISSRYRFSWTSGRVDVARLVIGDVERTVTPGTGEETITWLFPDPGADDTATGATETNSAVKLTAPGASALWLLGTSTASPPPPSPYKISGSSLNPVRVSVVRPVGP